MKLGLEKKEDRWKGIVLGVLGVGIVYVMYSNYTSDTPPPSSSRSAAPANPDAATGGSSLTGNNSPAPPPRRGSSARGSEFRPKVRPEDRMDPSKIDPTLKLDLLARVQGVSLEGGYRNIFQFGAAVPVVPAGPIPKVPPVKVGPLASNITAAPPPGPPPVAPPPQIPFKYYGYSSVKGEPRKRAFFLDGEDIIVAWEGDMIKNRYKVVRIGLTSVEMEDTQFKSKQSLPLAEDIAG